MSLHWGIVTTTNFELQDSAGMLKGKGDPPLQGWGGDRSLHPLPFTLAGALQSVFLGTSPKRDDPPTPSFCLSCTPEDNYTAAISLPWYEP